MLSLLLFSNANARNTSHDYNLLKENEEAQQLISPLAVTRNERKVFLPEHDFLLSPESVSSGGSHETCWRPSDMANRVLREQVKDTSFQIFGNGI